MTNAALLGTFGDVGGGPLVFRNKIINGGMVIDQRNNGASITPSSTGAGYSLDRWRYYISQASKLKFERSSNAPTGFINSILCTSQSAYSVLSTDAHHIGQIIEGFNISDLAWGTSSAKPITLSFWVKCSLTGLIGGSIVNVDGTRSYPFSYSVVDANTWEYKTVTITGDTTGTWATDNTQGIRLRLNLGSGSAQLGASGSWVAGDLQGPTGAISIVGTNGATLALSGVQIESGTVATPFEQRPYGTELLLCQRYYHLLAVAHCMTSENGRCLVPPAYPILRGVPTVSIVNIYSGETGTSLGSNVAVSVGTNGAGYTATGFGNILWRGMAGISYSAEL